MLERFILIFERLAGGEEEGFADGGGAFITPGPGLVGGELHVAAQSGEFGHVGPDGFEGGAGFLLLVALLGVVVGVVADGIGEVFDRTVGFDAGEHVGRLGVVLAGREAGEDVAGGEEDFIQGLGAEAAADVVGGALGGFGAFEFAFGGGLDGGEHGDEGIARGDLLFGGGLFGDAGVLQAAEVGGDFGGEGVDLAGQGGV